MRDKVVSVFPSPMSYSQVRITHGEIRMVLTVKCDCWSF